MYFYFHGLSIFKNSVDLIEGVDGNFCIEIFSSIKVNKMIIEDKTVNHVDVSSCGISLWKIIISNFNLKG